MLKVSCPDCCPLSHRYLLFHKPFNVLCQFTPGTGLEAKPRKTLADFISIGGVYPVGRLDQDSEGLLLLTDDGALQHRLNEPKFEHPRTYLAQVEGTVTENAADQLRRGIKIADYVTKAAGIRLIDPPAVAPRDPPIRFRANIPTSWLEIQLTEGRNRQVRRMTAAVGFPTLRLIRVAIDFLQLGQLNPGEYRELGGDELRRLLKVKKASAPPSPSFKKRP